jgi:hypothetical protein
MAQLPNEAGAVNLTGELAAKQRPESDEAAKRD